MPGSVGDLSATGALDATPAASAQPATGARAVRLALAALGGALYFLAYLGWGVWPLIFVFLLPLWLALERAPGVRAAFAAGLLFGGVAYAGGYPWLWRLVEVFLAGDRIFGAALWLVHGAWFALGFGVYAAVFHALRVRGASIAAAGIAPWLVMEWLQPQLFPLHAGGALVRGPWPLVQIADLGGPLLLSAFAVAVNAALFVLVAARRNGVPPPRRVGAVLLLLLAAVPGYGALRAVRLAERTRAVPPLRVGLVQANLGLVEKRTRGILSQRRHLALSRALLAEGPLDLLVWPETAYLRGIRRPLPVAGAPIREDLDVPLLFGGSSVQERDGRRVKTNSAFLVGADGMIRDAYDKNLLIPLAESLPFAGRVPGLAERLPHVQDFLAADDTPALHLGDVPIATPICYEAVRPDFVRRMVETEHAQLLVSLANDAWFGDSAEPWIHLHLARLRAVEQHRWMVRATNSGVSAVVDPLGRVVARTGLLRSGTLRARVQPLTGRTLYARLGDWPGPAALAALALAAVLAARRPRGGAPTRDPGAA